ncbi:MAG TPA: VIT domain-containing protein, partial [Myxococcaceae bacterium]|nr:VIT domain-containing protein [Myxococcaceae bacterium]
MGTLATREERDFEACGGHLVSADGRMLALRSAQLSGEAKGGIARVVLEQRFVNAYAEPLAVTYRMPLPADGAVSGYAFRIGERRIVGEVDRRASARERFERAILEGRTAAILDEERSSLFTQEIGNIPPGAEVIAELTIDQKLSWLPEGSWEWRFPTVVAPRYLGEPGRVPDASRVAVSVANAPMPPRVSLGFAIRDRLADGVRPESPSHPLRSEALPSRTEVSFAEEGAGLDRDVVVRWKAASLEVGVTLEVGRSAREAGSSYGLLTLVPPRREAALSPVPRDLIVLLDTSGSMDGRPLEQAKKVVAALVDSLGERDRLEMIEFSNRARRWKRDPIEATQTARQDAHRWLASLQAGGGTEMRTGLLEALEPLRPEAQRQIVLVTDGLIGSEHEVLQAIGEHLPPQSRVHVIGIGSAVNRSLSHPAARLGRGVELIVSLGEDAERAAQRIVARTEAPVVTELEIGGSAVEAIAPNRIPDLFAGGPALVSLKLRGGGGEVLVRGKADSGAWERRVQVPPLGEVPSAPSPLPALWARETVEDLEARRQARLAEENVDAEIERLGIGYQISTRLTSWVAISDGVRVDPTAPVRSQDIPQELPFGMSVQGIGLRPAAGIVRSAAAGPREFMIAAAPPVMAGRGRAKQDETVGVRPWLQEREVLPDFGRAPSRSFPAPRAPVHEPPTPRTLRGTVRLFDAKNLVVEIALSQELEWKAPAEVEVALVDGRRIRVQVDLGRSTREGRVPSGSIVRLVLDHAGALAPSASAPERLLLT